MNNLEKEAMAGLEELMDLSVHPGQKDMAKELIRRTNSSLGRWFFNKHKAKLAERVRKLDGHMIVARAHFESIRLVKEKKARRKQSESVEGGDENAE